LHEITCRQGDCDGVLFGVLPVFHCSPCGNTFFACFRVWPCHGSPFRRAGAEWNYVNHISVVELKSIGRCAFTNVQLTDRLKQFFFDELKFLRSNVLHCHAAEWQARLAIGTPENRNGIVYSAIRRCGDTNCLGRIIGRILRHVFIFLCDHEYIPWDVDMHTVTLHMQFHERPRALKLCFEAWVVTCTRALKLCFEAWVGFVDLRSRGRQQTPCDGRHDLALSGRVRGCCGLWARLRFQ
jgi:hypothetical protein